MKVLVLLSTWNGEKYLREQVSSLLNQQFKHPIEIVVRDDGSVDRTIKILEEMNDGRIRIIQGPNLGAKGSFLSLIHEASISDADYVAFADQDDVWEPNKLQRAIEKLAPISEPALYCSALNLVDDQLQPIAFYQFGEALTYEASFLANCATGCTCVINRQLLSLLKTLPNPDEIIMHDWWLYIVAVCFGVVVYDKESYILYRQHASNQIGMRTGLASLFRRAKLFFKRATKPSRLTQAHEFQRVYGRYLAAPKKNYLNTLLACEGSLTARFYFIIAHRPRRQNRLENLVSSVTFLLGR